jgi:predicted protein tyrosine phosphatase
MTAVITSPIVMPFQGCAAANTSHTTIKQTAERQASRTTISINSLERRESRDAGAATKHLHMSMQDQAA